MSTNKTAKILDFPVTITGCPTTLQEAIDACGGGAAGEEKLVSKFVGFCNAHSAFGDARSEIVDAIEKVTKISFKTDAAGEVSETDGVYSVRALHESGKSVAEILAGVEVKAEDGIITTGVTSIEVPFEAGGSRKAGGAKTPSKTYVENATKIIDTHKGTPDTLTAIVNGLQKLNPGATVVIDPATSLPTVDSLAAILKANSDRKRAEERAELAALGAA